MPKGYNAPVRIPKRPDPYDSLENIHKDVHGIRKQILDAVDALSRKLDAGEPRQTAIFNRLEAIFQQGVSLMSAVSDYAAKVTAHLDRQDVALGKVGTAVTGVGGDVSEMKALIEKLQTTPGPISAEDQATLDALEARVNTTATNVEGVASALEALDALTPPPAPPG